MRLLCDPDTCVVLSTCLYSPYYTMSWSTLWLWKVLFGATKTAFGPIIFLLVPFSAPEHQIDTPDCVCVCLKYGYVHSEQAAALHACFTPVPGVTNNYTDVQLSVLIFCSGLYESFKNTYMVWNWGVTLPSIQAWVETPCLCYKYLLIFEWNLIKWVKDYLIGTHTLSISFTYPFSHIKVHFSHTFRNLSNCFWSSTTATAILQSSAINLHASALLVAYIPHARPLQNKINHIIGSIATYNHIIGSITTYVLYQLMLLYHLPLSFNLTITV